MQITKPVTKPSKQRKAVFQASDHRRHKLFAAHISPSLKSVHGVRSLPVRSGDTVRVLRGDHAGFEGKITRIDTSKYRIFVEGLTREKVDGTTIFLPIHPSKVMITTLNLDDKWRKAILERKRVPQKKAVPEEKPKRKGAKRVVGKAAAQKIPAKTKPSAEGKPRARRKATKKPAIEKKEEKPAEKHVEEGKTKPEKKTRRVRRKTTEKAEGEK